MPRFRKLEPEEVPNYRLTNDQILSMAKHFKAIVEKRITDGKIERPVEYAKEYEMILGEDIIEGNVEWEGDLPDPIDPEVYYKLPKPVILGHNIENRIKKALQRGGPREMVRYLDSIGCPLVTEVKDQKIG